MITSTAILAGAVHRHGTFTPEGQFDAISYDNIVLTVLKPTCQKDAVGYDALPIKLKTSVLFEATSISNISALMAFLDRCKMKECVVNYAETAKGNFYPVGISFTK